MVITNEEHEKAKLAAERDPKLTSLFQLRNTTNHYLIQCLADREIQKVVWNGRNNLNTLAVEHLKSKAYQYNCRIIHSPHNYAKVAAIDGLGWESNTSKPCGKFRSSRDDTLLEEYLLSDDSKRFNRFKQESASDKIERLQQLLKEKEIIIERLITSKKHLRNHVRKSGAFEKDWQC
ncbi:uncharacterized protein LOC124327346 [Daphnia pulicaria]|uniref:uncharacterized protein LOC124327346 n=1 Tax=Daphnia pulicaria TaxID=35523 RepID=UPI001EEA330E|nr:uncharacterized protein LOC124327346 [Daphnia pulicaria]